MWTRDGKYAARSRTRWSTRNGSFGAFFLDRNGPFGNFWGPKRRMVTQNWPFFFSVCSAFLGSEKHEYVKLGETDKSPNGSTKNARCSKHVCFLICVLPKEKGTLQKCIFSKWAPFSVFFHLRDAQKILSLGAHFTIFGKLKWAPWPFEDLGERRGPISGWQVLSVSVSMENAMECQMTC